MGQRKAQRVILRVKVVPRSSRNQIAGREGKRLKVKLTAPPVEGKANRALTDLLAKKLGVAKSQVEIVSGEKTRVKSVAVSGVSETAEQLMGLLFPPGL